MLFAATHKRMKNMCNPLPRVPTFYLWVKSNYNLLWIISNISTNWCAVKFLSRKSKKWWFLGYWSTFKRSLPGLKGLHKCRSFPRYPWSTSLKIEASAENPRRPQESSWAGRWFSSGWSNVKMVSWNEHKWCNIIKTIHHIFIYQHSHT